MSQAEHEIGTAPPGYGAPHPQAETQPEEPARLNAMQRLMGVLFSPGETFQDINRKPTIIAPIIIAMVTTLASTLFFNWRAHPDWDQIMRTQIRKQVERSGQSISEDQIQQRVDIAKKIAQFSPIIGVIFVPVFYLILAAIFALGLMMLQAKTSFKKILSVVAWSSASIGIVGAIVFIAALMVQDDESLRQIDPTKGVNIVPTNLGTLLASDTSAVIRSLASSIDLFTIWVMVLYAIGFAAIAGSRKITTRKTGVLVFGLWILFVLVKAGWAAAFGG